jgi:hypothetical protein
MVWTRCSLRPLVKNSRIVGGNGHHERCGLRDWPWRDHNSRRERALDLPQLRIIRLKGRNCTHYQDPPTHIPSRYLDSTSRATKCMHLQTSTLDLTVVQGEIDAEYGDSS